MAAVGAMFGLPFVLPELRDTYDLTTPQAGALVGLPGAGVLTTLLGWGVIIDRYGERVTMTVSLVLTMLFLGLLDAVDGVLGVGAVLACVGASAGPLNAASGRLVLNWFAERERGLAMGFRQMAQPLGMGLAAAVLPVAAQTWGFTGAILLPAALCAVVAPFLAVLTATPRQRAPARVATTDTRPASPYRFATIWRIHAASGLLGVAQFTVFTYALVYLIQEHDWTAPAAGVALACAHIPGAAARLLLGLWSDRTGSRLRPVRIIAAACAVALILLAVSPLVLPAAGVALVLVCAVLTMSHNGLTFTAVAETAGMAWAGRAMATQNTVQSLGNMTTPAMMGLIIHWFGMNPMFAVAAVCCVASMGALPRRRR